MSDVQIVPEAETTAKHSPPELSPEEPAATARTETPAAAPPAAESSVPTSNTAATPEAAAAPQTAAAPEKVERGIGVSIVNPITAYAYRGRGVEIRRLSIAIPFVVGLCRPLGHRPSKLVERFAACVLDECRKLRLETRHAIGGRRAR